MLLFRNLDSKKEGSGAGARTGSELSKNLKPDPYTDLHDPDLQYWMVGLAKEFRSEKIPRNRLRTDSVEESAHSKGILSSSKEPIP